MNVKTLKIGFVSGFIQNLFLAAVNMFVGMKTIYGMITIGEVARYIRAM